MAEPVPSPQVRAEAAAWLARLHAQDRDAADEAGFRAWLNASPDHATAFEAVDRMWSDVGGLNSFPSDLRSSFGGTPQRQPGLARRRVLLTGVGLVALTGGSAMFWRSASAKVYETEVGEQKHVALDDGSQLFLDAQTRIAVSFSETTRLVDMQYGRANFRVVPDLKRPFIVQAAEKKIVATRCNFDVRCEDGKVQVVLIHGEADVRPASAPQARGQRLKAGERLVAANDVETRDKPDLTHVLAWQTGYEMFDKEDLAQAAEEMNRYSTAKLAVDSSVADLKVSGMYRVGDNSAFAHSLTKLLPVTVRQIGDTLVLTADPDQ
ncbi:MAG TPA: FecR domain-containing protein [Rhizomicrobium sp.]|jgi:transmembrane sensor|nr:FecR domain-containing protein [Rhizomicrobium sp.]